MAKPATENEPSSRVLAHPALNGARVIVLDNSVGELMMFNESYWFIHRVRTNNELHFRNTRYYSPSRTVGAMEPDGFFRTGRRVEPSLVSILLLDPARVAEASRELGGGASPRFGGLLTLGDPPLFGALGGLVQAFREPSTSELAVEDRLAAFLPLVLSRATEGAVLLGDAPREPAPVRRARDMIHDRFGEKLSLQELAAEGRLSTYALVRAFTNHFGVPPHAYQNQLRLTRARRALEIGRSASAAALEVGFYDQSHFAKLFKRAIGMTPSSYASAFRARGSGADDDAVRRRGP